MRRSNRESARTLLSTALAQGGYFTAQSKQKVPYLCLLCYLLFQFPKKRGAAVPKTEDRFSRRVKALTDEEVFAKITS